MKELLPEIRERRAYRAMSDKPVPDKVVSRIMEAAVLAPSCFNNQPWRFIVVREAGVLGRVKEHLSSGNYWAKAAPLIVAVCTRADFDCQLSAGRDYAFFDTGMSVANMLLQGVREGLYTHPIAGFSPLPIKEILQVPEDVTLLTLVIFGYPGETLALNEKHQEAEASGRQRRAIDGNVAYDRWPGSWV
ncbi:MAG: nitroreductase family protein [Spirochaetales bacterium]|nr:nitroreductase family protein [Spirochaetales bacterium]